MFFLGFMFSNNKSFNQNLSNWDVKNVSYCEDFYKVVESCPVPIVMAGGTKIPEKDALLMTENAIKEGASGVDMGRNIFQSENPPAMMKAIKAIVHKGADSKEAYDLYSQG